MIRIALKRIFNRKMNTITTILAMICVLTIVPLGIHFAQESKLIVEETIEQYGRGSYDILVRPSNSRTSIEKELGVVEGNYIGDSSGGITVEEWEEIKNNIDIEIAAPVASLGYFTGNRTSIGLPFLQHPAKFTINYHTTDGVNKYPIPDEFTKLYPNNQPQHENIEINQVFYFEGRPHEFVDYYAPTELSIGFLAILYPKNYYLLTAIDIESEGKLTGIDFTDLERELDGEEAREVEMFLSYRNDPPVIPILQRSELNIPLYLSLTVDEIVVDVKEYKDKYNVQLESPMFTIDEDRELEFFEEVSNAPILSTKHYDINLSDSQHPFNGTHLQLNENFQIEKKGRRVPWKRFLSLLHSFKDKIRYPRRNDQGSESGR